MLLIAYLVDHRTREDFAFWIDARLESLVPEWLRELLPRTRFSAAQYL